MRLSIAILFALFSFQAHAQPELKVIQEAKKLINNKKYESAFNALNSFDPKNANPSVVLLKEEIVLKYFVTSIGHQMFALKDLEKNEDVMDYRGKEGSFGIQMFDIAKVLDSLIKIHPDNCSLYKGLADYYYDVHLRYGGRWIKDDTEVFKLLASNLENVISKGCADYLSFYILGYIKLIDKNYGDAISNFLKSIELKNDYATAHYNLAYAYLHSDDHDNALKYAKNALDIYSDRTYKSDAARMIGQIYAEKNDDTNALTNYELADKIDPDNYYNLKAMLNLYVKASSPKRTETLKTFFHLDPSNPTIYNDLENIYYTSKKEEELKIFYLEQLPKFKNDSKPEGTLNFYLAKLYLEKNKKLARKHFNNAKACFSKVFEKDHPVFERIEEGLKEASK